MRAKCKRCGRSCHVTDKITQFGFDCCTDCAKEIHSAISEEVQRLMVKRGATKQDYTHVVNDLTAILAEW